MFHILFLSLFPLYWQRVADGFQCIGISSTQTCPDLNHLLHLIPTLTVSQFVFSGNHCCQRCLLFCFLQALLCSHRLPLFVTIFCSSFLQTFPLFFSLSTAYLFLVLNLRGLSVWAGRFVLINICKNKIITCVDQVLKGLGFNSKF